MSLTKEVTKSINTWVNSKMSEAVFDPKQGYYPFSIIADAYAKGVEFGEKNLEKKIKEKFQQNVQIVSSQIDDSLKELKKDNLVPTKLFLKLGLKEFRIVFCFNEEIYLSDKFMDKAYVLASDVRSSSYDKGILLSMGYLADNSNINFEDLKSDGFGIGIDLNAKKAIY